MIDGERTTCKACGEEIVQLGRGHRRREYCDENCRQAAFKARREQQHKDEVTRRWSKFTPDTRGFLDWIVNRYGEDQATAIEAAINRELEQQAAIYEQSVGNREKLQLELLAMGEALAWRFLINGQTAITRGEQSWRLYAEQTETAQLATAVKAAHYFYDNLKALGMLS